MAGIMTDHNIIAELIGRLIILRDYAFAPACLSTCMTLIRLPAVA